MGELIDMKLSRVRVWAQPVVVRVPRSADMTAVVDAQVAATGGMVLRLGVDTRPVLSDLHRAIKAFNSMRKHRSRCAYQGYAK